MSDDAMRYIVEVPKVSRKLEHDPRLSATKVDRMRCSSIVNPMDNSYVPDTFAEDGDPLEAIACVSEPTFAGCEFSERPIAVLRLDKKGRDHKVLSVPVPDRNWSTARSRRDLLAHLCEEIGHFFSIFSISKEPEAHHVETHGWFDLETANAVAAGNWRRRREAS